MNHGADSAMCELCEKTGGKLLWQDASCRVVLVEEPDYPGFCRIIWKQHIKEMTDLAATDQQHLMAIVFAVENAVREILKPEKINLASLGNMTPHIHWHVIPRGHNDKHFPNAIWGAAQRDVQQTAPDGLAEELGALLQKSLPYALN